MNPIHALYIDGEKVDPKEFVIPDMSLSSGRAVMRAHSFIAVIDPMALIHLMTPLAEEWIREMKVDDALHGGPDHEWGKAGYPSLEHLIEMPKVLDDVVDHYFFTDLVRPFTAHDARRVRFWYDQVRSCRKDSEVIIVTGVCYSRR